jgi:hypothetical protein
MKYGTGFFIKRCKVNLIFWFLSAEEAQIKHNFLKNGPSHTVNSLRKNIGSHKARKLYSL